MSTTTTFNLERLARAIEERDASTQTSMYAPDATTTIVDSSAQPSSPRILTGRDEIQGWIVDVTSRDLTHRVTQRVQDADGAALVVACRYPDGTQVLCSTVFELDGGQITHQTLVQVWDEA